MKNNMLKARIRYSDNILNENIKGYCLDLFNNRSKEWDLYLFCKVDDKNMMSADFVYEIESCIAMSYEIVV